MQVTEGNEKEIKKWNVLEQIVHINKLTPYVLLHAEHYFKILASVLEKLATQYTCCSLHNGQRCHLVLSPPCPFFILSKPLPSRPLQPQTVQDNGII